MVLCCAERLQNAVGIVNQESMWEDLECLFCLQEVKERYLQVLADVGAEAKLCQVGFYVM